MNRPGLLYADAVGVLTNGEGLSCAAVLSLAYGTLESLDSLAVTLFDLVVDLNGIAYGTLRSGSISLFCFNVLNHFVHLCDLPSYV